MAILQQSVSRLISNQKAEGGTHFFWLLNLGGLAQIYIKEQLVIPSEHLFFIV
jgi:hypothetical protein